MRKRKKFLAFLAVSTVATALLLAPATTANAALHSRYFKMPSRNIHCAIFSGNLRCDILSGLKPEPQRECDLDWTGLILVNNGKASPVCAGDTVVKKGSNDARVRHEVEAQQDDLHVEDHRAPLSQRKGHGFFLSRDSWRKF